MKFILQIIIFLVIQSSFSQELVSFKGDTLMDITDTLNECTNAFGNPEAEEYCRCWITSIAEKVSYESFKNEYYAALIFGVDKIEKLQQHEDNGIYEKALKILETYFGAVDD